MACDRCASGWIGDIYASGGAGVGGETPEPCPHCPEGRKVQRIMELEAERDRFQAALKGLLGSAVLGSEADPDLTEQFGELGWDHIQAARSLLREDT